MKKILMLSLFALGSLASFAGSENAGTSKTEKDEFTQRWSCKWYFKVYEQTIFGGYVVIHTETPRISGTEQEMLNQAMMHANMLKEMWIVTNPGGKNRYLDYGKDTSVPCLDVSW